MVIVLVDLMVEVVVSPGGHVVFIEALAKLMNVVDLTLDARVLSEDPIQQCSQFGFVMHWKNLQSPHVSLWTGSSKQTNLRPAIVIVNVLTVAGAAPETAIPGRR